MIFSIPRFPAATRGKATPSHRRVTATALLGAFVCGPFAYSALGAENAVDFNRHIQPILSENCYACHGPDPSSRKPKRKPLRLDRAEFAFLPRGGDPPVIVQGEPDSSVLIERIMDAHDPMPPEESHKSLKPEEKELLRKWIEQGAEYKEHWSFLAVDRPEPPAESPPPATVNPWVRTPIDAFIARGLESAGLTPNADQEPHPLIRRLAFDLTGLPPKQELVERFAKNPDEKTYAEIVEELLASPAYGEQWARHWLDAVRYADTHGIHIDNYRSIWPYRDWVIGAFNANMSFDQFTVEQLAGDMLPNASLPQRVASGFNRCLATTSEGGAIDDEYLAIYAKDRVDTTFAVWQGLTTGCASCHDHKFDPITQKDFYALTAFFRNNTMRAMDGNYLYPAPVEFVPRSGDEARWAESAGKVKELRSRLETLIDATGLVTAPAEEKKAAAPAQDEVGPVEDVVAAIAEKKPEAEEPLPDVAPGPLRAPGFRKDLEEALVLWLPMENGAIAGTLEGAPWASPPLEPAPGSRAMHAGLRGRATNLDRADVVIGESARVDPSKGFSAAGWFYFTDKNASSPILGQRADAKSWSFVLRSGRFGIVLVNEKEKPEEDESALILDLDLAKPGTWNHVALEFLPGTTTQGWSRANLRVRLYVNGRERALRTTYESEGTPLRGPFVFDPGAKTRLVLGAPKDAARLSKTGNEKDKEDDKEAVAKAAEKRALFAQNLTLFDRPLGSVALSEVAGTLPAASRIDGGDLRRLSRDQQRLAAFQFLRSSGDRYSSLAAELEEQEAAHLNLRDRGDFTLVMEEEKDSKPSAHILIRGDYSQPGEVVEADIPQVFGGLHSGAPRNREGLSRWLVSRDNPLTARVTMNRYWYYLFGTGIVDTTEDFGIMGARPAHPDLLDWLAAEFMDSGWDLKHMLRALVASSTYRQSPVVSPEKQEKDPDNRLVSRGPRYRLDAEQLRDLALAASGLLVDHIGGPSVRPYQPEGIWETVAMMQSDTRFYEQGRGDDLYRRSLYTFWKRVAPLPSMEILNAPSREVFCVRRDLTNTPLQALVMLNDVQFVEASRVLAEEALGASKSYEGRLEFIGRRLLNRGFTRDERRMLEPNHRQIIDHFAADAAAARELLAVGEAPLPPKFDPAELAAWTVVASQVLNFDETLTK